MLFIISCNYCILKLVKLEGNFILLVLTIENKGYREMLQRKISTSFPQKIFLSSKATKNFAKGHYKHYFTCFAFNSVS